MYSRGNTQSELETKETSESQARFLRDGSLASFWRIRTYTQTHLHTHTEHSLMGNLSSASNANPRASARVLCVRAFTRRTWQRPHITQHGNLSTIHHPNAPLAACGVECAARSDWTIGNECVGRRQVERGGGGRHTYGPFTATTTRQTRHVQNVKKTHFQCNRLFAQEDCMYLCYVQKYVRQAEHTYTYILTWQMYCEIFLKISTKPRPTKFTKIENTLFF